VARLFCRLAAATARSALIQPYRQQRGVRRADGPSRPLDTRRRRSNALPGRRREPVGVVRPAHRRVPGGNRTTERSSSQIACNIVATIHAPHPRDGAGTLGSAQTGYELPVAQQRREAIEASAPPCRQLFLAYDESPSGGFRRGSASLGMPIQNHAGSALIAEAIISATRTDAASRSSPGRTSL
jgi:hypothetical protein